MINVTQKHFDKILRNTPAGAVIVRAELKQLERNGRGNFKERLHFSYQIGGRVFSSSLGVNWATEKNEEMMVQKIKSAKNIAEIKAQGCVVGFSCTGVIDADHIKSKGAGGDDSLSNLWPLCRGHHRMRHDKGLWHMVQTYENCKKVLVEKGHADLLVKLEYKLANDGE